VHERLPLRTVPHNVSLSDVVPGFHIIKDNGGEGVTAHILSSVSKGGSGGAVLVPLWGLESLALSSGESLLTWHAWMNCWRAHVSGLVVARFVRHHRHCGCGHCGCGRHQQWRCWCVRVAGEGGG
jgi:hypothetical protein